MNESKLQEIARLCAFCFGQDHDYTPNHADEEWQAHGWVIEAMKAALAASPTPAPVPVDPVELAELRRDAARYRWLRDEATSHLYVRKNDGGKYGVSVCTGVILDCEVDMRRKAAPHGERREAIPQPEPNNDAMWRALCGYLLKCDEPIPFLEAWTHGEWDQCAEWTDAPIECYPPEARSAKL